MSEWKENEKYVMGKIEDCDGEHKKQSEINKTQSDWNHSTDKRIDKIAYRQTGFAMSIAALTAMVVENSGQFFKMITGFFK